MLMIGKTPAPISVKVGHYFQGRQGLYFWGQLKKYKILNVPLGHYEDEVLLEHGFGLTDIVKVPHEFGNEPTAQEYKNGLIRIQSLIIELNPYVLMFVYKGVLDKVLALSFGKKTKSQYGFNNQLNNLFQSKVFVFPMPGTPCKKDQINNGMAELKNALM